MLKVYYISTNLRSHLSGNKLIYSKFAIKAKSIKCNDTMGILT